MKTGGKIFLQKCFGRNFLWLKNHFQENVPTKNYDEKFFVENFLWLQNYFLKNRFVLKMFIKTFLLKIFMVAKSFPREKVATNNFHGKIFDTNFLLFQNHFLWNRFEPKIFIENFLVENFYDSKIISSGIGVNQKFSSRIFLSKNVYGCRTISTEIGLYQELLSKSFRSNIFYGRKIISS